MPKVADIAERVAAVAKPGDTILLLGAGDINTAVTDIVSIVGGRE